jgi:hypothetical protein
LIERLRHASDDVFAIGDVTSIPIGGGNFLNEDGTRAGVA